ncbi:MAG: zinc-ribbon domain-containing protein [Candidatus Heimdallarchaeota archaeon]|nr:zinc-ribbon domain-containing protein [Candidatus Heimdallarchaeota archaeon]
MGITERYFGGSGNIWTLAFGIGFLIWGIVSVVKPNAPGGWWMFIPGGILFVSAISNIISYRYNRERILGALKSYQKVPIKQLAKELRMKEKEIKEIIIDLRTAGRLKASFDPESGEVVVLEVGGRAPREIPMSMEPGEPSRKLPGKEEEAVTDSLDSIKARGYCPYCGSKVQKKDRFCITCGAALE